MNNDEMFEEEDWEAEADFYILWARGEEEREYDIPCLEDFGYDE